MAAEEMLKFGYQLGQGLDVVGHGKASLEPLEHKQCLPALYPHS